MQSGMCTSARVLACSSTPRSTSHLTTGQRTVLNDNEAAHTSHLLHAHTCTPRSTSRLTTGQRTALNDIEEAHTEDREGNRYYVYEHLAQVRRLCCGGSMLFVKSVQLSVSNHDSME